MRNSKLRHGNKQAGVASEQRNIPIATKRLLGGPHSPDDSSRTNLQARITRRNDLARQTHSAARGNGKRLLADIYIAPVVITLGSQSLGSPAWKKRSIRYCRRTQAAPRISKVGDTRDKVTAQGAALCGLARKEWVMKNVKSWTVYEGDPGNGHDYHQVVREVSPELMRV